MPSGARRRRARPGADGPGGGQAFRMALARRPSGVPPAPPEGARRVGGLHLNPNSAIEMLCLRWWGLFTAERKRLPSGEGQGLLSPNRRPSLPNRRVALRGPAPRAKPAGAPPYPWGFLPRIQSGVGGKPNPLWVKIGFGTNDFPSAFRSFGHVQLRDLGSRMAPETGWNSYYSYVVSLRDRSPRGGRTQPKV